MKQGKGNRVLPREHTGQSKYPLPTPHGHPQMVNTEIRLIIFFAAEDEEALSVCSVTQSCLTLCDPMDCSTQAFLSFTISQSLLKLMSISNAIQLPYPLSLPSPHALNLSQQQGLFQWVSSSYQGGQSIGASASVLPINIQDWFPLGLTGLISLLTFKYQKTLKSLLQHHSLKASLL